MTWVDIGSMVRDVRGFNAHAESAAADRLMHRAFLDHGPSRPSVAERVVLLDKLWSTQMFYQADHAVRVIKSLEKHESKIVNAVSTVDASALEHDPNSIVDLAKWAMPLVLALTRRPPREGQPPYVPYAFASRYLHWTAPHVFPIADVGRARLVINELQREHGMRPRVRVLPGAWDTDYPSWIHFYSRLIGHLTPTQRQKLLDADASSRPDGSNQPNTLLRVLDKAFYWQEQRAYLPTRAR